MSRWIVLAAALAVAILVSACSSASSSVAPSAGGAASPAAVASSEPSAAASTTESATPSATEAPSAGPSGAIPSFTLPSDDKALEALLPDKLCGANGTKLSFSGARFSQYPDATLSKTVAQLGKSVNDVAMAIATSAPGGSACREVAGVLQVKGADPNKFRDFFIALAKQENDTTFTQGSVGGKDVYIGVRPGDKTKTYAYFNGDALFFVSAADDAAAAPLLQQMP